LQTADLGALHESQTGFLAISSQEWTLALLPIRRENVV